MNQLATAPHANRRPWAFLIVAILLFALLMALRDELASAWLRAGAAAVAFTIFGLALQRFCRNPA